MHQREKSRCESGCVANKVLRTLPPVTRFWPAALLCLAAASFGAQPGDGFVVQERPGIVFVKPQPWSKDSEATMFEFQAFINRTADGGFGAGYYEFRTKTSDRRQIPTARIVKLVTYPDVRQFKEIIHPEDRRLLVSTMDDLQGVTTRYPASRTYLEPFIRQFDDEVARYDSGQVKIKGEWVTRDSYVKGLAMKLADLLKVDISRAKPPSSLRLEDDPKFVSLQELAKTNVDARQLATGISAHFDALVRAEKRGILLAKLERPATSLAEAQAAVGQLKALQPEEDAQTATVIKTWDSGVAFVETASVKSDALSDQLERELTSFKDGGGLPNLSPELRKQISALNAQITHFLNSKPPHQLSGALEKPTAVCQLETAFTRLKTLFADQDFIDAKDALDELAPRAALIGPETVRVVSSVQRKAVEKIEQFTRLRAEGKLLVESGKKREALDKLEAAFAVMPNAETEQQISQLKQEISSVSSKGQ